MSGFKTWSNLYAEILTRLKNPGNLRKLGGEDGIRTHGADNRITAFARFEPTPRISGKDDYADSLLRYDRYRWSRHAQRRGASN